MVNVPVSLRINDEPVNASIEARKSLGDFLREDRRLTGLHLACEHGVCGACNVYIDGDLSRSCTTLAVTCDGASVRTIEGFDDDALTNRLRAAFSQAHALQCGFCTPGMLLAARDIVKRFPGADEALVRRELSGNLCRCTGYAGIVQAILAVAGDAAAAESADGMDVLEVAASRAEPGRLPAADMQAFAPRPEPDSPEPVREVKAPAAVELAQAGDMASISRQFELPLPRDVVWQFFADLRSVASCMPGMAVEEILDAQHLKGVFSVKVGPIRAAFATSAAITRDDAQYCGQVQSEGNDRLTRSKAVSRIDYRLEPAPDGRGTLVRVTAAFRISGRLAEFSRTEIVLALANQLTERFAFNVEQKLADPRSNAAQAAGEQAARDSGGLELGLGSVIWQVIRSIVRALLGRLRRH